MCGRYAVFAGKEKIQEVFGVTADDPGLFEPNFNATPGSMLPVVLLGKARVKRIGPLRWGLIPGWADDTSVGYSMINARSETLLEKPSFKKPFQRQRCIVPASGFYEWQKLGKAKIPYYIRTLDQEVMGFAGLFDKWEKDGQTVFSFTIITTAANDLLAPLHERMPVILRKRDYDDWLDPLFDDLSVLQELMKPYPTERMSLYRVSDAVNTASNNGPELVRPVL
jgi:putative SOS response-associated peptidase YedK